MSDSRAAGLRSGTRTEGDPGATGAKLIAIDEPRQPDGVNYSLNSDIAVVYMSSSLTMVYWKGDQHWLGKLLEHPEIMTQGESVEELEENLKDAFRLMAMDEVPQDYKTKEIAL